MVRPRTPLQDWLEELIGREKRFRSDRQLSLEAGFSDATITKIRANGSATLIVLDVVRDRVGAIVIHAQNDRGHNLGELQRPVDVGIVADALNLRNDSGTLGRVRTVYEAPCGWFKNGPTS